MRNIFGILACLLMAVPLFAAGENSWVLSKEAEGIKVFTRPVEGSPVHEFRGETTIDAPLEKVIAFFERTDRMVRWFHRTKEAYLFKRISDRECLVYFAADLPWPISDRDGIYRQMKTKVPSDGIILYTLQSEPDIYPPQKNRVRVHYLEGEWKFTKLEGGRTAVEFRLHTAAGGYIPPAILNRFTVWIPFKTLRNLRRALNQVVLVRG